MLENLLFIAVLAGIVICSLVLVWLIFIQFYKGEKGE
jgi:uncharacterized membrane protein